MIDLDKYDFDVRAEYLKILPYFYQINQTTGDSKEAWINYLQTLAGSLEVTQGNLLELATRIKTFLNTTGQHMSLEGLLNDTYDAALRRINIIENDIGIFETETWFLQNEGDPENKVWFLQSENDPFNKIWYLQSEIEQGFPFTIEIPSVIIFDEVELRALIDNYVIAGKKYNIVII